MVNPLSHSVIIVYLSWDSLILSLIPFLNSIDILALILFILIHIIIPAEWNAATSALSSFLTIPSRLRRIQIAIIIVARL